MVVVALGMRMRMMLLVPMLLDVNGARLVELPLLGFETVSVLGTVGVRELNIHGVPVLIKLLGEPKDAQRLLRQRGLVVMSAMLFVFVLGLLAPPMDGRGCRLRFEDCVLDVGPQLQERRKIK